MQTDDRRYAHQDDPSGPSTTRVVEGQESAPRYTALPAFSVAGRTLLGAILILSVAISLVGITWGLPSRTIDKYLFGDDTPWSGEKIYHLAGTGEKFSPARGADVDVDPLDKSTDRPIPLTATDEDVAKIYLRYRLYTYQPDEMITMMALAGMNPRRLDLDPRLYQYGGLFIYPVGALIGACGLVGLIDVRSDVVYYLDNPDEFARFYLVARAYSAAWGLIGVIVVFAVARRLASARGTGRPTVPVDRGERNEGQPERPHGLKPAGHVGDGYALLNGSHAGLLAALSFTLMPVVICMAHEGKPHLPGAVLMLLAALFAMRHLSSRAASFSLRGPDNYGTATQQGTPRGLKPARQVGSFPRRANRDFWLMCVCCGAALGTVLSSWPIFVLIPLVVWLDHKSPTARSSPGGHTTCDVSAGAGAPRGMKRAFAGVAVACAVYLITNPYVLINAFVNRDVLRSNFGNSLAMYEIARIGEGFVRVIELTVEGATLPLFVLGVIALIVATLRRGRTVSITSRGTGRLRVHTRDSDHAHTSFGRGTEREPRYGNDALPLRVAMLPLAVPGLVFFVQFVLIGAGKPAEYGRFGIFTNTALAIGSACLLARWRTGLPGIAGWVPATVVVMWLGACGAGYVWNFRLDATNAGSRNHLAQVASRLLPQGSARFQGRIGVLVEPAPYSCPPLDFRRFDVALFASRKRFAASASEGPAYLIEPVDGRTWFEFPSQPGAQFSPELDTNRVRSKAVWHGILEAPISWANKPFETRTPDQIDRGVRPPDQSRDREGAREPTSRSACFQPKARFHGAIYAPRILSSALLDRTRRIGIAAARDTLTRAKAGDQGPRDRPGPSVRFQ